MSERLGMTLGLGGGSVSDEISLCEHALGLGYTDVWTAEVAGADGFAPLAPLARTNDSARLGTAIVPVFTRSPALLAMSAATIQNLSGGRFILGLGTSSHIIVENWMGGAFDRPITRLRQTVEVLRDLLAGKKVTFEGDSFRLKDFKLTLDPGVETPIYVAALGARACRLAGAIADGVIFFLKSPDGVRQGLEWVAEGAREAGRDPNDLDCVMRVTVAMDEDPETLAYMGRRLMTTYAMVDVYNRSLSLQGFEEEAQAIVSAWKAGEREKASESVSDRMLQELNIFGDVDACRAGVQRFRDAGVKTPVVAPVSVDGDPAERVAKVVRLTEALAT
jgi:probable F420-dependent oxidoreductase